MGDLMIKKIFSLVKKIILSFLLIYAYNKLTLPYDLFIPINIFTVALVTILGIPSIVMLILFYLFII